jgi:hypothetical protein
MDCPTLDCHRPDVDCSEHRQAPPRFVPEEFFSDSISTVGVESESAFPGALAGPGINLRRPPGSMGAGYGCGQFATGRSPGRECGNGIAREREIDSYIQDNFRVAPIV